MDTPQPNQELTAHATLPVLEEDLGELELRDLIDAPALQAMMDHFYAATNIGIAAIRSSSPS